MIEASVIVCTRNRARLLEGALESLVRQEAATDGFEVIVVDNASTDDTAAVCSRFAGALPLRRVVESTLGLNPARNRGIEESQGRWIGFLDDDARAAPGWIEALSRAFRETDSDAVGGPVVPRWEEAPPGWLHPKLQSLLAVFDLGARRVPVTRYPFLVGTNLAVRRETFDRVGQFHPDLDRRGASLISFGDTELCARIVASGGRLVYEPTAVVDHVIPSSRTRVAYVAKRSWAQGRSERRYLHITGTLGRNPSTFRSILKSLFSAVTAAGRGDRATAASAFFRAIRHAGYLSERGG